MQKLFKTLINEPLTHFLLLGLLLFIYFDMTATDVQTQNKTIITLSSSEIIKLKTEYKNRYHKEIDTDQLQELIEQKFYEKLLVDEALSLNLVMQDDVIIKHLLKQMQFIMLNSKEFVEPTEEELLAYYKSNIKEYSHIKTLSFSHIYFSKRDDERIEELITLLNITDKNSSVASSFGDKFQGTIDIKDSSYEEIKKEYGNYFTSKLFTSKSSLWHNKIFSKYGTHLVYITDKNVTIPYSFDDVQDRVYEDYLREQRTQQERDAYKVIKAQYILKVQK